MDCFLNLMVLPIKFLNFLAATAICLLLSASSGVKSNTEGKTQTQPLTWFHSTFLCGHVWSWL